LFHFILSRCHAGAAAALLLGALAGTVAQAQVHSACSQELDARLTNSCVVADRLLWRGARPDDDGAQALIEQGVKTIVNLELMLDDRRSFTQARPSLSTPSAIAYFKLRDWEPLAASRFTHRLLDEHVAKFIAITRTQAAPLYVHCRSGRNRTGVMVASWKILQGVPIEAAIADMQSYHGEWVKADTAYLRKLTPKKLAALEQRIQFWSQKVRAEARITCAEKRCTIQDD
jgi:protein tyrosine phosphatase